MKRPVFVAGHGLACARGLSAAAAAEAIWAGDARSAMKRVGEREFPYFPLPLAETGWAARAEAAVRAVGAQLPRLSPQTPLFVASSSFQIGEFEEDDETELPVACAAFAQRIAGWLGLEGPCHAVANACISSFSAITEAAALIGGGLIDDALVVGSELSNASTLAGFSGMALLSPTAARPLAADRDGLVLGEAVAAVYLSAAPGPWKLAGTAVGLDAHSPTGPEPGGGPIAGVMAQCLAAAGWAPSDVGLVKLQAAGSPGSDLAEARALSQVFGDALPPLLSLKPWLGHTLGASGAAELSALFALLDAERLPATPSGAPDDEISAKFPVDRSSVRIERALLNLIGFGGGLASIAVERAA